MQHGNRKSAPQVMKGRVQKKNNLNLSTDYYDAPQPHTMGLNNGNGRVESLLERIAHTLENSSGENGGMRPGEAAGNAYSSLQRRDLGQTTSSPVQH